MNTPMKTMSRVRKNVNRLINNTYNRVERSGVLEEIPRRFPNGRNLALIQGTTLVARGLWPLVARSRFLRFNRMGGRMGGRMGVRTIGRFPRFRAVGVHRLNRTAGLLMATTGAVLIGTALRRDRIPRELGWLAAGHSVVLGWRGIYNSITGRRVFPHVGHPLIDFPIALGWISRLSTPESSRTVFLKAV